MARKKTKSDEIYNARRRYRRQAERYEKKASATTGATKARYEAQARIAIEKGLALYQDEEKPQGKLKTMAQAFNVGFSNKQSVGKLVERSINELVSKKTNTREEMAQEILSIDNIGSRFYGGLSEIWTMTPESRNAPNKAILEYFGAKDIMEVIEKLEQAGIDIYSPESNGVDYHTIQLQIQEFILQNRK